MRTSIPTCRDAGTARAIFYVLRFALGVLLGITVACHPDAPAALTEPTAPTRADFGVHNAGTWTVTSLADPGDGLCTNRECTLREAIAAAQAGERITFKSNLSGTIALTAGALVIDRSLTIEADHPLRITVDGQGASTVFHVDAGAGGVLVNLQRLTITGGNDVSGGGIRVLPGASLNLIGSIVNGNTAESGGALFVSGATVQIVESTIAANTASTNFGGGIYVNSANLTVSRSTISGNTAALEGGGIFYTCEVLSQCQTGLIIASSTITSNDAPSGGGVHVLDPGPFFMSNTIIAGNTRTGLSIDGADCNLVQPIADFGHNLSTAGTGCALTHPTDVVLPFASQLFLTVVAPVLAPNGGGTPTHALIERGLAIDAGSCPGENTDQRGFPRPFDDVRMPDALDACDIGAFEWNPPIRKGKGPTP